MRSIVPLFAVLFVSVAVAQEPPKDQPDDDPDVPDKLEKLTLTLDPGGHTSPIRKVFFTPDSKQAITLGKDHSIRIWDVGTGQTVKVLHPPGHGGLFAAALSPDGKRLTVASRYPEGEQLTYLIYILALPDGRIERILRGHTKEVKHLVFAPDGKRLASAGDDITTRVWDLDKDQPGKVVKQKMKVTGLAFSPDGDRLACAMGGSRTGGEIIELTTGKVVGKVEGGMVAWSPDGKTLATARGLGGYSLWDADGGKSRPHDPWDRFIHALTFSADSRTVLVMGRDGRNTPIASIVDVATGKELLHCESERGKGPGPDSDGALSPDGRLAITGGAGENPHATIWHTKDGTIHKRLFAKAWITGGAAYLKASWAPDGKSVSWKWDTYRPAFRPPTFHLGELGFGQPQTMKDAHTATTTPLATVSKLRGPAILIGKDRAVQVRGLNIDLLDLPNSKAIRSFKGHSFGIRDLVPSPDGRFLMSFAFDQTLCIWGLDLEREKPLLTLYVNGKDWVISTPEGYYAATPGGERMMGWRLDNGIDKMPTFYSAEHFKKQLYRPDVIKLVLEKGSVEEALKAANAALKDKKIEVPGGEKSADKLLPPAVTISVDETKKPKVKVKVTAKEGCKEQPIKSLWLFVGNKPEAECKLDFTGKETRGHEQTWEVTLPPGRHTLSVLARSKDDTPAVSNFIEVVSPLPPAARPVVHHLGVGINVYANGRVKELHFSRPDAEELGKAFTASCEKSPLYQGAKVKLLVDKDATSKAVLDAIDKVRKDATSNDLFVFSFAGHGMREDGEFFLLTHEADPTSGKTLATTAIGGKALREKLADFPCQVLLMLDACHSGALGRGARSGSDEAARELSDVDMRVAVMCAALGHEEALGKGGHGYFTAAVVKALRQDPKAVFNRETGVLHVYHLNAFVYDEVTRESKGEQTPFLKMPLTQPAFVVAQFPK